MKHSDESLMRRAIAIARRGGRDVRPNPCVGALIVKDGTIIARGWHHRAGGPHAEVEALTEAGEAARGATVYVSLEPCNHRGRTGPCSEALINAGVRRVVVAAHDPNPNVPGGGVDRLRDAGIEVLEGVCASEAAALNRAWLHSLSSPRPLTTVLLSLSLNGRPIDDRSNRAFALVRERLRRWADARIAGGQLLIDSVATDQLSPDVSIAQWETMFAKLRSDQRQSLLCEDLPHSIELAAKSFADLIVCVHSPVFASGTGATKFDLLAPQKLHLLGAHRVGDSAVSWYEPRQR
ncbi:MAG: bifunctional diaminohydroxyphosphoribosylaminopyrimidine deaminase/5-amino-6-(5-phosphoribosylamino)uracil reductase RibD [Bdellovibrionota bacterium]